MSFAIVYKKLFKQQFVAIPDRFCLGLVIVTFSPQHAIVYSYITLTNWTLTKKCYIGFRLDFSPRIDSLSQFLKIIKFFVICLNNFL